MKLVNLLILLGLFLFAACETPEDILNELDHTVPDITFIQDTLYVTAGNSISTTATIFDEAGLDRIEFSYGNWLINDIFNLQDIGNPSTHNVTLEFTVPMNATKEWEELKYFNDGSSVRIIQRYHRLELKTWDVNRNMRTGILYVSVE